MRLLLVTEKATHSTNQRDGGAQLVDSLKSAFSADLKVLQFDIERYPHQASDRFMRRVMNAEYVSSAILSVCEQYDVILIVHVSMAFLLPKLHCRVVLFPMFLTPSYRLSGESVPDQYEQMERMALYNASLIITPSYFELRQLETHYQLPRDRIRVIPRGVDVSNFSPSPRALNGGIHFCSVGSIKPQKNSMQLLDLFEKIVDIYPGSTLTLVGPIQNELYFKQLCQHPVYGQVTLTGFVSPSDLKSVLAHCHIHLSFAFCETFGRAVFETLALGLPNVICSEHYAGYDYLQGLPYVRFCHDMTSTVNEIGDVVEDYHQLSAVAGEISILYDDTVLKKCIRSEVLQLPIMAVSDFDGTLFHKDDPLYTKECMEAFKAYPFRVICSARGLDDILAQCQQYQLTVDYIIAYSGALVAKGSGEICWIQELSGEQVAWIYSKVQPYGEVRYQESLLQLCVPKGIFLREEVYEQKAYVAHPYATKLHAVVRLLSHIQSFGRVRVFGDGPYDQEMIAYFNGVLVKKKELIS